MFSNSKADRVAVTYSGQACADHQLAGTARAASGRMAMVCRVLFCLLAALVGSCARPKLQTTELTVVSYGGGAYQESHRKAFVQPFQQITGVRVNSVVWNADYGKLKAMVESGRVPWDVVEVTEAQFARGTKENLFEKLILLPDRDDFLSGTVSEFGVGNVYWGTVLAYTRDVFRNKQPQTWADFWDVDEFPGPRALYDDPRATLEFALLADGVPLDKLYPIDIDRAFLKLDEIKPHVRVWWTDGSQPVQLLLTGSVVMSSAWNGRLYASDQARAGIGYSWQGAALELDYWVVPRGSANTDAASRFIFFASQPYTLAAQTELVGYGPVNKAALQYVRENARTQFPTYPSNWKVSFPVNAEWWSEHEERVKTKWLAWKMS